MERMSGMDFLAVQEAIEVHFLGLVLAATLFSVGIVAFIVDFVRYGKPQPVDGGAGATAEAR